MPLFPFNSPRQDIWRAMLGDPNRWPRVMGILNVTPDSFSDGGNASTQGAVREAVAGMLAGGVDVVDVGGESTRPGAAAVSVQEQIARVVPAINTVRDLSDVLISIDTTRAVVAEAALDAGADIVNDISAGRDDPDLLPLVARRKVPVVLMHMQGTPLTMQADPKYGDVVSEVRTFLVDRANYAASVGVDRADIVIDPGIGFGKTVEHNLQLLRRLPELTTAGYPVLVGSSRKGFIGKITGETRADQRQMGTAATVAWAAMSGVAVVRVHDVADMTRVVRMARAIRTGEFSQQ